MMKLLTSTLCAGIFSLGLLPTANAALEVRLGGKAVYDTDLNITWLANANAAANSSFDGGMFWEDAMAWVALFDVGGITGWRLPSTDPVCLGDNCNTSEMGHLFYNELGGKAQSSILTSGDPDLVLFSNINTQSSSYYWSSTRTDFQNQYAIAFSFEIGHQGVSLPHFGNQYFMWPVHDGDVATLIPEPQTYAMLLVGLLAIFGFVRLRPKS